MADFKINVSSTAWVRVKVYATLSNWGYVTAKNSLDTPTDIWENSEIRG